MTEKLTLIAGEEKIILSYFEDENRVQLSLPRNWVIDAMPATAGRKRIDMKDTSSFCEDAKSAGSKSVSRTNTKKKAKAEAGSEKKEPSKPRQKRNRKTVFSG